MSNYRRGYRFELLIRDFLEAWGYLVVRAAGSKGVCDLVALAKRRKPALIECKVNGYMTPNQKAKLVKEAQNTNCIPVLASKPEGEALPVFKDIRYKDRRWTP